MSNGAVLCCAAWVCCDEPDNARKEIAKAMREDMSFNKLRDMDDAEMTEAVAGWMIEKFDLVPRGLGRQIVAAYRPLFEHAAKDEARRKAGERGKGDSKGGAPGDIYRGEGAGSPGEGPL